MEDRILTQQQNILEFMKANGSITKYDGFEHLRCTKVDTRLSELRRKGHKIIGEWEKSQSGARYLRYSLDVSEVVNG